MKRRAIPNNSSATNLQILLSPTFLTGVALLLINDFYLKDAYGNFLTGKLSDFAGLFTVSLFLSAIFPNRVPAIHLVVGGSFVFWKTPLADPLIELWNAWRLFSIERTVDYSDYIALAVLPLSYAYFLVFDGAKTLKLHAEIRQAAISFVIVVSVFAFGATSTTANRSVTLPETYFVRESRVEIENLLLKDPKIKDLVPRIERSIGNSQLDRSLYYFDLKIDQTTCDSSTTKMMLMITDRGGITELAAINIGFECGEYTDNENVNQLNTAYIEHARVLFNRHILSKLTIVTPNDKTPRT